ncbi:hypothetical protein O7635_29550 [Asanoa sp. WMMD1127]|uniref:hypothetical protein n=1 Tax=Asanoa sp. WMMD1127 TaxID=3016107 RepID=UPI002416E728|nr:hypothetical protein [Asanoa sp. WMMD1127]MDG4826015.1 hypothetical protein [Asanoa sp. WMMD1127]
MSALAIAGTVIASLAGFLGLVALGGVFWARFRTAADETTAALWKEEAQAWKSKAERLEAAFASLEKRVGHLEAENVMLRQLHDSRQEMADLRAAITDGFAGLATLIRSLEEGK